MTLAFIGSRQQNEVGSLRTELVKGISNDLQVQDNTSVQMQLWLCLTQQRLLSLNIGRTRHNKLTKREICFLNIKSVSISIKPVPVLCLIRNAYIHTYIIHYTVLITSKHVIRVQRIFTSGLYSNKSWSPVRKSSFWNNCMFSQRLST